jgi:hypothetical protein
MAVFYRRLPCPSTSSDATEAQVDTWPFCTKSARPYPPGTRPAPHETARASSTGSVTGFSLADASVDRTVLTQMELEPDMRRVVLRLP